MRSTKPYVYHAVLFNPQLDFFALFPKQISKYKNKQSPRSSLLNTNILPIYLKFSRSNGNQRADNTLQNICKWDKSHAGHLGKYARLYELVFLLLYASIIVPSC